MDIQVRGQGRGTTHLYSDDSGRAASGSPPRGARSSGGGGGGGGGGRRNERSWRLDGDEGRMGGGGVGGLRVEKRSLGGPVRGPPSDGPRQGQAARAAARVTQAKQPLESFKDKWARREKECPFLVPVWVHGGSAARPASFYQASDLAPDAGRLSLHTWADATLGEIAEQLFWLLLESPTAANFVVPPHTGKRNGKGKGRGQQASAAAASVDEAEDANEEEGEGEGEGEGTGEKDGEGEAGVAAGGGAAASHPIALKPLRVVFSLVYPHPADGGALVKPAGEVRLVRGTARGTGVDVALSSLKHVVGDALDVAVQVI